MSTHQEMFEKLSKDGESYLEELKDKSYSEDLYTEFKDLSYHVNDTNKLVSEFEKVNKQICAFANSEGGIIIIGVKCKKNPQSVDCIIDIMPIKNIGILETRLKQYIINTVHPTVKGVRSVIIDSKYTGKGYLAILIPKQENPLFICAKGHHDGIYYARVADSCKPIYPEDMRKLTKPSSLNEIIPYISISKGCIYGDGTPGNMQYEVYIKNKGGFALTHPFVLINTTDIFGFRPISDSGISQHFQNGAIKFRDNRNIKLIPGESLKMCRSEIPDQGSQRLMNHLGTQPREITIFTGADETDLKEYKILFSGEYILSYMSHNHLKSDKIIEILPIQIDSI